MGGAGRSAAESTGPPESEIITRAKAGDHEAFRVLVERYQGRAYRLARRIMGDDELAQDVVQEAFLKAYASLGRFEGRSKFYTWLYRLVFNLCIDTKRRDRSPGPVEWSEEHPLDVAPEAAAAGIGGPEVATPSRELERKELGELMARAIEALPEDASRTLLLREVDGLSYAEIAQSLGVPKGTVMSRLHYARRRVRAALVEAGVVDLAPTSGGAKEKT
jgi:RNA polymerase sigma-70 factor (ECF subfamily)